MKKILLTIALILLIPALSYGAAGVCTQSASEFSGGFVKITFVCTGSTVDGSIPDTALSTANLALVEGTHYLYRVTTYPTSGGTAPDAADVFVLDSAGQDLLGSVDGGTTANKGLNLIHATLTKSAFPYEPTMGTFYTAPVNGSLTLKVSNQATISANYTIEMIFSR